MPDGITLHPSDSHSYDVLAAMPDKEVVRCEISRPRNRRHHNLAQALISEIYKNQTMFATRETMVDAIKIAIGHYDAFTNVLGKEVVRPRSIAWHMMDQTEFEEWWHKFLGVILTNILPHANNTELEKHIYHMLGERGPDEA